MENLTIDIQTFALRSVLDGDRTLFNVNNIWSDGKCPDDYVDKLKEGNCSNWIDKFHSNVPKIKISRSDCLWMRAAFKIGRISGSFPKMYTDELLESVQKYDFPELPEGSKGWFIRTDKVSLKNSMHGIGPYTCMKQIFESLVTSRSGHAAFDEYSDLDMNQDDDLILYFLPWISMDYNKEFRIFVYQNQITAISDQHLYTVNHWLSSLTPTEIKQIVIDILTYFDNMIKNKMAYMTNYVMDLAYLDNDTTKCYFIEPNSFGSEYASGSALFNWISDHELLYNSSNPIKNIPFRFVNSEN